MDLKINISTNDNCQITVQDLKVGYLPEDSSEVVINQFKYSQTNSVTVLQHNKSTGPEIISPQFNDHTNDNPVNLSVKFDGWFTIVHNVLPNKTWFDAEQAKGKQSALNLYDTVYFIDGTSLYKATRRIVPGGSFSSSFGGSFQNLKEIDEWIPTETSIEEVALRNTEGTTISRVCENYVSICFLNKCYISLCQQIFNKAGFTACDKLNTVDSDLIYKRDLVWMTINVVNYMVHLEQLAEVERLINRIGGCNGLCKNEFTQIKEHDCGCR